MSEPLSTGAGGLFAWKAIGGLAGVGGVGAGLASYVVMTMTKPKSDQEWHMSLISTLVGSFCGGPALIKYLGIEHWVFDPFGLMGILGICFTTGLPGWLIVRSVFAWMEKRKDVPIDVILADGMDAVKKAKEII